MYMKNEVLELKKELEQVREQSFANEILQDYKKTNKRQFVIILVILIMWFVTIGYLIYILNDIGVIEETTTYEQEVSDIDNIGGNIINKGDLYGEN